MKSRRALSTVVGAVFAIIALTSTVTYISYSMGILNNYNQSVLTKNQQLSDVNKEKFQISSVTVPNSKLNITIVNTGSLPINFTKIWIQNTTTTDWVRSYVPTHNFVAPGSVLTNIGQNSGMYINPANSYNVKLVTSRGNTQQFIMNSANVAPLNIQLIALPANVVSGFTTELVMVVTNNGSSTLTNITPASLPTPTGLASCVASAASPSIFNSLPPGGTAIFKWDIVATSGGSGSQTCTYTLTKPLQNGYHQILQATITVSPVRFTSTNLSAITGVLTINYTSFQYSQGSGWKNGWSIPSAPGSQQTTGFSFYITNNNSTADFYIDSHTQIYFKETGTSNSVLLYIMNSTDPFSNTGTSYTCPNSNNFCVKIPAGKSINLYFGSITMQNNNMGNLGHVDTYYMALLLYGKFIQNGVSTEYAQDIPFMAILGT